MAGNELLASAGGACDTWMILRDVKYAETQGHTGAVIALAAALPKTGSAKNPAGGVVTTVEQPLLYSASLDGTIRAWDPFDMSCLSVLRETRSEIACLHHSPLCDFLLTGHDDGTIRLWNVDSGSTITLSGHTNTVCCLGVTTRGAETSLLLSSGFDGQVGIWDVTKRQHAMPRLELLFSAHSEEVFALQVSQHSSSFVTAGNDKKIRIWSLKSFELLANLEGHSEAVTCLAIDGNFLLSGAEDGTVRMWDLHSFMALGLLRVHEAPVEDLLIVPGSGWLITCSTDHTVRVWDYGTGQELKAWRHPEQFRCIALKRSTSHVVAGTDEHHIVSFPLSDVVAEQRARAAAESAACEASEAVERESKERDTAEAAAAQVPAEAPAAQSALGAEPA